MKKILKRIISDSEAFLSEEMLLLPRQTWLLKLLVRNTFSTEFMKSKAPESPDSFGLLSATTNKKTHQRQRSAVELLSD